MRNFAKTLAVMGVLTPAGVNALGVGEIKLHSALNQKLLAEIPLLTSAGEDVSQIRVRLAPSQAFAQAGLDRPYFLTDLRFKPLRKPDGSVVIQVTSTDVIREPFLDFLVEVEWPQGRMLREFTVLLDPPVTYDDAVRVVQSPPGVTPRPVRAERTAAAAVASRPHVYGPVRSNESLWNIAQKLKPDPAVTTEQMIMAIYRENPDAFLGGNVNALKAGVTLKVPDRDAVMALPPRQARREFQQHYRDWMARRSVAEAEVAGPEAAPAGEPGAQLKLEAPAEPAEVSQGQVEVPVIEGPNPAAPETAEALAALKAENRALKARLETLEKRLAELIELQNATLARLQKESGGVGEKAAGPEKATVPSEREAAVKPKPSVVAKPKSQIAEPKQVPEPAEETSLLAGLLDEPIYLSLGGGSLFLLAVAGFLIWRRRQAADEQADSLLVALDLESAADDTAGAASPVQEEASQTSGVPETGVEVSESSFLSEFTPSDFDILETENDAVDPIAEADVYLAYGRYQQAEELIKQSLAERPDDPALRLKLLEIYYANEDGAAYREYARELQAAGADGDVEFWNKVVEMGRELGLDDAIFAAGSAPDTRPVESPSPEAVLDFDLGEAAPDSDEVKKTAESEPGETGFIDLDPNGADDEGAVDEAAGTKSTDPQDFSFDFESPRSKEDGENPVDREESRASSADEEVGGLDFDLGGIELPKNEPAAAAPSTEKTEEADGLEFSLTPEDTTSDSAEGEVDLIDMDELDTKLDLARAYMDMEDVDTAKEILEEVLARGDGKQKQEAQNLLNQLGVTSSS